MLMNRITAKLFYCLLPAFLWLCPVLLTAGGISSLSTHFVRTVIDRNQTEKTEGDIFYTAPNTIHVVTESPVRQHTIIQDLSMTFFYPAENKTIVITSEKPFDLPFIPAFLLGMQKDFGLSVLKFQIESYSMNKETLSTVWKRKGEKSSLLDHAYLKTVSGHVVSARVQDTLKNIWSKMEFDGFVKTPTGSWMASKLSMDKNGTKERYHEEITLSDVKFNVSFPDSIRSFRIPPNAKIEKIEW